MVLLRSNSEVRMLANSGKPKEWSKVIPSKVERLCVETLHELPLVGKEKVRYSTKVEITSQA